MLSKKKIAMIYDKACKELDDNNKNFCKFKNNKCCMQYNLDKINGCCKHCLYQSENGCTTSNLTCKLYYCPNICKKYDPIKFEDIEVLKSLTFRQKIILKHDYFSKREDVIMDLYLNSILLFTIRIIYRYLFKKIYRVYYAKNSIKKI